MKQESDDQGFQQAKQTYILLPSKVLQQKNSQKQINNILQPPISVFKSIKNYPTPQILNSVYSLLQQKFEQNKTQKIYKKKAWCADLEIQISEQFLKPQYELIYRKFNEQKTNYRYYREYGKDQYNVFQDDQSHLMRPEGFSTERNKLQFNLTYFNEPISQQLIIHSNFEAGNLQRAYIHNEMPNCYFLWLSNDTNTIGFNQWFYFKVMNPTLKNIKAKFILVNVNKKTIDCLSKIGIAYFSLRDYRLYGEGWKKTYKGIAHNLNNNLRRDSDHLYHTIQFQYEFKMEQNMYFSLALPYTFSKMEKFISSFPNGLCKLGVTFCGNPIYAYKLGNSEAQKAILITARQHPSQMSSSFALQGVIKRLEKNSPIINFLKKKYQIIIIPMVNPDGVIHGNSRTNLLGFDINRKWEQIPNKDSSPEIYCIYHNLLKKVKKIQYLIDLHGHSKKLNSFAYFTMKKNLATIIAYQMSERVPWFKIQDCQLCQAVPYNTLRYFAADKLGIKKAITIETSIHGWTDQNNNIHNFMPEQMQAIGSSLIDTLSRMELQRKSCYQAIKNIKFAQNNQNSDSDPEGDYFKKNQQKSISPTKNKRSTKVRIKTCSTNFHKNPLNSSLREKSISQCRLNNQKLRGDSKPLKQKKQKEEIKKFRRINSTQEQRVQKSCSSFLLQFQVPKNSFNIKSPTPIGKSHRSHKK